jgi:activator of HSP90 ATPase
MVRRTLTQLRNPTLAGRGMITRRISLHAPPHTVYVTLLDSDRLTAITGQPASINPVMGGDFSALGGYLSGVVSELLEDRLLVIAVRPDEPGWEVTHLASATFMLKPDDAGCLLNFFQQDVPTQYFDFMTDLWEEHFWARLPAALR